MSQFYKASLSTGVYGSYLWLEDDNIAKQTCGDKEPYLWIADDGSALWIDDANMSRMPIEYKASLSSGVYGGVLWLNPEDIGNGDENEMVEQYKPALSTGVYGGCYYEIPPKPMPFEYCASINNGSFGSYLWIENDSNECQSESKEPSKGFELEVFLQKNKCFNSDLLAVLCDHGVTNEEQIKNVQTNMEWNTISREVLAKKRRSVYSDSDSNSKKETNKILVKFEKIWRKKTGLKGKGEKGGNKKKAQEIFKKWMNHENVFDQMLFDELCLRNILELEKLKSIDQSEFDKILRKVRLDKKAHLKSQKKREKFDELLVNFEKKCRKKPKGKAKSKGKAKNKKVSAKKKKK